MIVVRQKSFGLLSDILKGAIKGAAGEIVDKKNGGDIPVFGTLAIHWCVDKSRYIGKNWTYIVSPDCSVEANDGRSTINWSLSENFKPLGSCPSPWNKFTIKGVAKDGDYLPATIIMENGAEKKGRVLVEVVR